MSAPSALPVAVRGLVRGRELSADALALVDDGALRLDRVRAPGGAPLAVIPLRRIEGVRHEADQLVLFLENDDVIELSADRGIPGLAREVVAAACSLPELTRALRALGTSRATAQSEHDRFFGPFLDARRRAELAREPSAQVAAFETRELLSGLGALARAVARERYPEHPAAQRALEAELTECLEPLVEQLGELGDAAALVQKGAEEMQLVAWRRWARALADVFVCADRCWVATDALLLRIAYAPDPWWERFRRRTGR